MIENLPQDPQSLIHAGVVHPVGADARWYAVQTMPRHEKKVSQDLTAKAIECFLPTVTTVRQWSDRKRSIVEPLFTGYVFARLAPDSPDRITLLRSNGVVGLVGTRGVGVPIPENEIRSIQQIVESRAGYASHPFLSVGKRVRVRGGALDGLEGILQSVRGDESLVVSVELIRRSMSLTISGYVVEPIHESTTTLVRGAAQG